MLSDKITSFFFLKEEKVALDGKDAISTLKGVEQINCGD